MRKCTPESGDYNECRKISNARFDYEPDIIYYCESVDDVKTAVEEASQANGTPVRIRAGGHQHEGMCSGNAALIIDVTGLDGIRFVDGNRAWIGAGARLGAEDQASTVYCKMKEKGFLFPGGGCADVRVGGLVQGGGWGPLTRRRGLTCDTLIGFRMITASGERIEMTSDSGKEHARLHRALCGGGGGNFGVVTEYLFDLEKVPRDRNSFTLAWTKTSDVHDVLTEWGRHFPKHDDNRLTSYCRVTVMDRKTDRDDRPIIIGGSYLGKKNKMDNLLKELLPDTYDRQEPREFLFSNMLGGFSDYQPGPPIEAIRALPQYADFKADPPSSTCDPRTSFPHKVSSSFPKGNAMEMTPALIKAITNALTAPAKLPEARLYLSLHCMGGQVREMNGDRSCFAFRNKPVILQSQAWWANPDDRELERKAIAWIRKLTKDLDAHTEGAFINFPDKDLVPNPDAKQGRIDLLRKYYGGNLEDLVETKKVHDKDNLFDFEMGIPTSL